MHNAVQAQLLQRSIGTQNIMLYDVEDLKPAPESLLSSEYTQDNSFIKIKSSWRTVSMKRQTFILNATNKSALRLQWRRLGFGNKVVQGITVKIKGRCQGEGGGIEEQPRWVPFPSFLPSPYPFCFSLSSPFKIIKSLRKVEKGSGPHTVTRWRVQLLLLTSFSFLLLLCENLALK